jgi:cytochrome c oxidase subunit 2
MTPSPGRRCLPLLALAPALACARPAARLQSALHGGGVGAQEIATLWWAMLAGAVAIFVVVMALVLLGVLRPRPTVPARLFIIGGGIVFPAVTLTLLLVYSVRVGARLAAPPPDGTLTIELTGHMWWWDVRYGGSRDAEVVTANELRIPVGRPVRLRVRSEDVIHSFWVPNLAGKIDLIPGRTNVLTLQAEAPGTYRGQCAEFCGLQHTQMALHVVAEDAAAWDAWYAQRRRAAVDSFLTPRQQRGREVFAEAGCGSCHAIRGLSDPPAGIAPDLTLVGARPSLGAGVLPNSVGHLAAWIAGSQSIKPGNRMPSFHALDGPSLTALADFLSTRR